MVTQEHVLGTLARCGSMSPGDLRREYGERFDAAHARIGELHTLGLVGGMIVDGCGAVVYLTERGKEAAQRAVESAPTQ